MNESWINFLTEIDKIIKEFEQDGCDIVCFRGHSNKDWDLEPTLFVHQKKYNKNLKQIKNIENSLYFDFVTNAGTLLNSYSTDWEILFLMRHHGVPTRILDWTENFGTALFFALSGQDNSPTIYILDPYKLNQHSFEKASIPNPLRDLNFSYTDAYLEQKSNPFSFPLAMIPPRTSDRLFAQKGLFTLQGTNNKPLNKILELKDCFRKVEIPQDAIPSAHKFLKLFGVNNYSIFPDLDGLAKHLTSEFFK